MKGIDMKKIIVLMLCIQTMHGMQSQFNRDFTYRFGPNSPIYNTPLYFGEGRKYHIDAPPRKQPRKNYRTRSKAKKEKCPVRLNYERPA